jgi:hypothetical protein
VTDPLIPRVRALLAAASPGRWEMTDPMTVGTFVRAPVDGVYGEIVCRSSDRQNAALIAAAPDLLRQLADRVAELEGELLVCEAARDGARNGANGAEERSMALTAENDALRAEAARLDALAKEATEAGEGLAQRLAAAEARLRAFVEASAAVVIEFGNPNYDEGKMGTFVDRLERLGTAAQAALDGQKAGAK